MSEARNIAPSKVQEEHYLSRRVGQPLVLFCNKDHGRQEREALLGKVHKVLRNGVMPPSFTVVFRRTPIDSVNPIFTDLTRDGEIRFYSRHH
jgi:hypothetical protein